MFMNRKERIEEDLKIMQRSMFGGTISKEDAKDEKERVSRIDDSQEKLTFSDFIGLCGAAFAVVLPWALAFVALMALMGWLLVLWIS